MNSVIKMIDKKIIWTRFAVIIFGTFSWPNQILSRDNGRRKLSCYNVLIWPVGLWLTLTHQSSNSDPKVYWQVAAFWQIYAVDILHQGSEGSPQIQGCDASKAHWFCLRVSPNPISVCWTAPVVTQTHSFETHRDSQFSVWGQLSVGLQRFPTSS